MAGEMREYRGRIPYKLWQISRWAKLALESKEDKDFLWEHTCSEDHYTSLLQSLERLARLDKELVEWMWR